MKKKFLAVAIAAVMMFCVCGCGNAENVNNAENGNAEPRLVRVTHAGGEGYTLMIATDADGDGIFDGRRAFVGELTLPSGSTLCFAVVRDGDYRTSDIKVYAGGELLTGAPDDADGDPLSDGRLYTLTVTADVAIEVTGAVRLGRFTLHVMNSDGTQRYRTFCRADSVREALAQVPGYGAPDDYPAFWEPNPGEGYAFRYWRFDGGEFVELSEDYRPDEYADIYCGYVAFGEIPACPGDAPTVPPEPQKPAVPRLADYPELVEAMQAVADLDGERAESSRWVLAWAAYHLARAGVEGVTRPTVFGYANVFDAWYDDLIRDYIHVAANELWTYAYDLETSGSSPIDFDSALRSSFFKTDGSRRNWANNEAIVAEIADLVPGLTLKESYTVGGLDDANMCIVLILDRLGREWEPYGTPMKGHTVGSVREYVAANADKEPCANVIKKVYDAIDSLAV